MNLYLDTLKAHFTSIPEKFSMQSFQCQTLLAASSKGPKLLLSVSLSRHLYLLLIYRYIRLPGNFVQQCFVKLLCETAHLIDVRASQLPQLPLALSDFPALSWRQTISINFKNQLCEWHTWSAQSKNLIRQPILTGEMHSQNGNNSTRSYIASCSRSLGFSFLLSFFPLPAIWNGESKWRHVPFIGGKTLIAEVCEHFHRASISLRACLSHACPASSELRAPR